MKSVAAFAHRDQPGCAPVVCKGGVGYWVKEIGPANVIGWRTTPCHAAASHKIETALTIFPASYSSGTDQSWRFDVPAQDAIGGIAIFARQAATVQLLVSEDAVRGRRTSRVRGDYRIEAALTLLLRGSGLRWRRTGPSTYSLTSSLRKDLVR